MLVLRNNLSYITLANLQRFLKTYSEGSEDTHTAVVFSKYFFFQHANPFFKQYLKEHFMWKTQPYKAALLDMELGNCDPSASSLGTSVGLKSV